MRRAWSSFLILAAVGVSAVGWVLLRARVPVTEAPSPPTALFEQVMSHVRRFGVDSLPESELYQRAANGLLGELDDEYATILRKGEQVGLTETPDVGGLGLLLSARDGQVKVMSVLPGSSADLAGVAPGDLLLEANDVPLDPERRDQILGLLAGPAGTSLRVRVRRPGTGLLAFELARAQPRRTLVLPAWKLSPQVGYIAAPVLGPGASRRLREEVAQLIDDGVQALVLDLRGSSQGLLEEGVALADLFLEPGARLMEVRSREPSPRQWGDDKPQGLGFSRLALAVLVDSSTADAAEAAAGALQDNDRALLLGQPTFGRGSTAETFSLDDRMIVRISTGRWFTPIGRPIQRDTAAADTLAQRPQLKTPAGRAVYGGGGIVPDSILNRDTLPSVVLEFQRAVGSRYQLWNNTLRAVAAEESKRQRVPPEYVPGPAVRSRLGQALGSVGITIPDVLWGRAVSLIDRSLGDEVVRAALGDAMLQQRLMRRDGVVRRAAALLRAAPSPTALVLGDRGS
jgi:carboxyl-terminal processing protease